MNKILNFCLRCLTIFKKLMIICIGFELYNADLYTKSMGNNQCLKKQIEARIQSLL